VRGLRITRARPGRDTDGLTAVEPDLPHDGEQLIGPAVIDDATVHLVLDLSLRIGELELSGGAGAADVTATMLAVIRAYSLPHCEVDVIFTSITATCHRGVEVSPVTTSRVVRFRTLDYTRLAGVDQQVIGTAVITASAIGLHSSQLLPPTSARHWSWPQA
jgi:hypothetical protein